MSFRGEELVLAESMLETYGPQAISRAQELLDIYAATRNRDLAEKWLRITTLIEVATRCPGTGHLCANDAII